MEKCGVLVKRANNGISNEETDFLGRYLFLSESVKAGTAKPELQFQILTISTIVISLFEELETILKEEPYEIKANPENGFESNVVAEKRITEAIKSLILYSLRFAVPTVSIDIECSKSEIKICLQNGLQIPDTTVSYLKDVIRNEKGGEEMVDGVVNKAAQIIRFSRATLGVEKDNDNSLIWKISFWNVKEL